MSDPARYTVGLLCALPTEAVAVSLFLDEEHPPLARVSPRDNNSYMLGRIGGHCVVIANLPEGYYGISSAAALSMHLFETFPNIRICLSVGIGGGAPSTNHDIRLGDVVVGLPGRTHGGVCVYDYNSAQLSGSKSPPPTVVLEALAALKAHNEQRGPRIDEEIETVLEKSRPRIKRQFQRPDQTSDKLYRPEFLHQGSGRSCADGCGDDDSSLAHRPGRLRSEPITHYGLIVSSNQLMKDATLRDTLANDPGALCFEMEAAGFLNALPCLFIRGIADYSDFHKNLEWQNYAAIAAAAYAK